MMIPLYYILFNLLVVLIVVLMCKRYRERMESKDRIKAFMAVKTKA